MTTVQAETLGTDDLLVAAFSDTASDTEAGLLCDDVDSEDDPECTGTATVVLRAVAAPPAPSSSGAAPSTDADAVADTGVHDLTPQLLLALLALTVGAGLTVAGRTTYRGRHGGH